jgi:GNAT superfamily N-acetyltransferase
MKVSELFEKVNDKIFWSDFHEEKSILGGEYKLVAMCGWIKMNAKPEHKSDQFRIVARTKQGSECGWVNFENKDGKLEALDLSIQPAHRRKGIATEMYKFARELGNDITPSRLQTGMGKLFWSKKDHRKEENQNRERNDSDFI